MPTSKVTYLGELRTSSIHLQSGSEIISNAPIVTGKHRDWETIVTGKHERYRDWETDRKSTRLNSSHRL